MSTQILVGWSSGGAMASAFLDHAHEAGFATAHGTSYDIKGLVLLASGGEFCYAYDTIAELKALNPPGKGGRELWQTCTAAKTTVRKSPFWRHFYTSTISLPRQAWDEHMMRNAENGEAAVSAGLLPGEPHRGLLLAIAGGICALTPTDAAGAAGAPLRRPDQTRPNQTNVTKRPRRPFCSVHSLEIHLSRACLGKITIVFILQFKLYLALRKCIVCGCVCALCHIAFAFAFSRWRIATPTGMRRGSITRPC
jgi:hypothetical protein